MDSPSPLCANCRDVGASKCAKCGVVSYCSKSCQLADWPLHKRLCGRPVTIAAVADRGRGLVAVRDVAAGELILRDRAVVTLARGVKVEEAGYDITLLQRQVNCLPEVEQEEFYKLSKRKKIMDMEMDSPYKKAIAIFFNNAIASGCSFGISVDNGHERSVYLLLSLLNHSCVPNSAYTELDSSGPAGGVVDRKHKELRAIREIKKGEEVTISYLGFQLLLRDKEYRQRKLFDSWDFRCSCSQCGETRRAEEEGRLLADIRKLMKSKLRASETLDFSLVAEAHAEIVELVQKLTCASLLMPQFAKDLADAGHLAREPLLVQKGMKLLKETSELRKSPKLQEMYRNQEKKLSDWKFEFEEKSSPGVHEIMNVLRY